MYRDMILDCMEQGGCKGLQEFELRRTIRLYIDLVVSFQVLKTDSLLQRHKQGRLLVQDRAEKSLLDKESALTFQLMDTDDLLDMKVRLQQRNMILWDNHSVYRNHHSEVGHRKSFRPGKFDIHLYSTI